MIDKLSDGDKNEILGQIGLYTAAAFWIFEL